jgi:IS30 family transposase
MLSIQGILTRKSKLPMNYKHLSQIERHQIARLMKAQHNITQIASLIGRLKATISCEPRRNAGSRGYRLKQASELAMEHSEQSRNACTLPPLVKEHASALPQLQWRPSRRPANNRSHKQLGFRTPAEVFHQSLSRVALRARIHLKK